MADSRCSLRQVPDPLLLALRVTDAGGFDGNECETLTNAGRRSLTWSDCFAVGRCGHLAHRTRQMDALALDGKLTGLNNKLDSHKVERLQQERAKLREAEDKLKREIRSLNAREHALQSEVDGLRTQVQEIPALRQHFEALVKEHGESKQRRVAIANDLRTELASTKANVAQRALALADVGKELEDVNKRVAAESGRAKEAEDRLKLQELDTRHLARCLAAAATSLLSDRAVISPAVLKRTENALHASRLRSHRLQRQVTDRDAQTAALVELIGHLEGDRDSWRAMADDLNDDFANYRHAAGKERGMAAKNRKEAGERIAEGDERLREATMELEEVKMRLKVERRTAKAAQEAADLRYRMLQDELEGTRLGLRDSEAEVTVMRKRMPELEAQVKDVEAKLTATRAELETERVAKEDALKAKSKTENALSEVSEARARLTGLLSQSRAGETALQEQLASAEANLEELQGIEEAHTRLRQTLETFVTRSDLAERDAAALAQINAELGGHATTQQKIHHLAKVRGELGELRRKFAAVTAELAASKREADKLRDEVGSYKGLGVNAPPMTKLSRVLRPILGEVGNRRG